jgi:hypothetical protein
MLPSPRPRLEVVISISFCDLLPAISTSLAPERGMLPWRRGGLLEDHSLDSNDAYRLRAGDASARRPDRNSSTLKTLFPPQLPGTEP